MKRQKNYRNKSETKVAEALKWHKIKFGYESLYLYYQLPQSKYLPDFVFKDEGKFSGGQIWEVKGRFDLDDRRKHIALKDQHPQWKVKFLFLRPSTKVYKKGKMTYGGWCEKYGFDYCALDDIPKHWWKEIR